MRRLLPGVLLAFCVIMGVFVALKKVRQPATPYPVLPTTEIDLGDRPFGDTATAGFVLQNNGDAPLLIDSIKTSCGCVSLHSRTGEKIFDPSSIEVPPKSELEFFTRVAIRGDIGKELVERINITTNCPQKPSLTVTIRGVVTGGPTAVPSSVSFGTMAAGTRLKRLIQVVDSRQNGLFKLGVVKLTDSSRVKIIRSEPKQSSHSLTTPEFGRLCCEIELEVMESASVGVLNEQLHIFAEGEQTPSLTVPIYGNLLAPIIISPATLVLPRRSEDGLVFVQKCQCQHVSRVPFELRVSSVPAGLSASLTRNPSNTIYTLQIACEPSRAIASLVPILILREALVWSN